MGNVDKQALTIGLTLEHEDGVVRAQKWLKGFVTLEIHDEDIVLREDDNTLTVELVGREVTVGMPPKKGHPAHVHVVDIFHDSSVRRIMEHTKLNAHCQYRFPFSIYTPGSIPPTMEYKDRKQQQKNKGESSNSSSSSPGCRIEYQLTASFHSYTTERKIHMVGQPVSNKAHPATVEPSVAPVLTKSIKWRNMLSTKHRHRKLEDPKEEHHHGCLIWAARIKDTHVGKGQEASFSFALRNASSYEVQKLSARLVEKVSWKTSTGNGAGETHTHATELEYILMPNLAFLKHQHATVSKHQSQLVQLDHVLAQEMHEELALHENTIQVPIPTKCRDSYKGKFIQVSHYLFIEARTAQVGNQNGKDPNHTAVLTLELPLKICGPPTVDNRHHHLQHNMGGDFEFRNPADVAEIVMTKWPTDEDEALQTSFSSVDDTSWDASEGAVVVPQIREVPRED